ncbi:tyrosinase family protein [Streptomyces griseus]|uniref:tyrosinase family protein n=1 Tax=Streptomyces griseus TaxID=1911 RepID=UPI000564E3BC|nr:tyrosinase family protein [Streptomyces griseus]
MTEAWDDQLLWYARAVRAMRAKPETKPTSWIFQANIHGTPQGEPSDNPEWNNCPHGGWFFLPWHRAYILCFEEIVRHVVKDELGGPDDWALPYWNYTRVTNGDPNSPESQACRRLPPEFLTPDWPDGDGANPLFLAPPDRDKDAAAKLSIQWPEVNPHLAMQAPHFTGVTQFGSEDTGGELMHFPNGGTGLLEEQPHNHIHGFVGGVMGDFASPRDPVFWLHHANIDRLWSAWRTNPDHKNPTDADWLGFTHHFRDAQGNRVGFKSQDLVDEQQLGYRYESLTEGVGLKPPERLVAMLAVGADPPPQTVVATTGPTGPTDLGEESVTVPLSPEPAAETSALTEAASPETPSRAILTIADVRADTPPGTNYRVYLGARPDHEEDLDPEGPYFIGHIHFFGAVGGDNAHHHGHGGPGLTFKFDITDQLTELRRMGRWDGEGIPPVVVTPAPLGPPPDAAGLEAGTGSVMPTVPPGSRPRIGSVSLMTTEP